MPVTGETKKRFADAFALIFYCRRNIFTVNDRFTDKRHTGRTIQNRISIAAADRKPEPLMAVGQFDDHTAVAEHFAAGIKSGLHRFRRTVVEHSALSWT